MEGSRGSAEIYLHHLKQTPHLRVVRQTAQGGCDFGGLGGGCVAFEGFGAEVDTEVFQKFALSDDRRGAQTGVEGDVAEGGEIDVRGEVDFARAVEDVGESVVGHGLNRGGMGRRGVAVVDDQHRAGLRGEAAGQIAHEGLRLRGKFDDGSGERVMFGRGDEGVFRFFQRAQGQSQRVVFDRHHMFCPAAEGFCERARGQGVEKFIGEDERGHWRDLREVVEMVWRVGA